MIGSPIEITPLITLVGPPNSGKTTLFNYLSGKNYKTVNYPGSTVDYSVCKFQNKYKIDANLLDSPGIISLIPSSLDEKVAVDSLYDHPDLGTPDLIITTVDASQFSRHLLLTKQILQCHFRVIIVLTMNDLLAKKGFSISAEKLSNELNCPVIKIDGRTGKGIDKLLSVIDSEITGLSGKSKWNIDKFKSSDKILDIFKEIELLEIKVVDDISGVDLNKANSKLKILTNSEAKKNCNYVDNTTIKIDRILLHKVWGLAAFFLIMSLTFTSIFYFAQPLMDLVDSFFNLLAEESAALLGNTWYGDLVSNGIISGFGSVSVFVPQIIILFLILGLLEDTGYLARGAMLVDKPFSRIGLNGKSFVPMLSGFACAIPAIMAARTIPNRRERLLTIFIIPLMSCSARLPVYALMIGFLVPADNPFKGGILLASIYIFGLASSILIAGLINKFRKFFIREEDNSSFILELPAYRVPKIGVVLTNSITSTKIYFKKAGPIILIFAIIIWFLSYFPNSNPYIEKKNYSSEEYEQKIDAERLSGSYAAMMGKFIQPVMQPLGMDWRVGVAILTSFAAREVFVSSLALIFKVTANEDTFQQSMLESMHKAEIGNTGQKLFTTSTILGLVVFFIFALQCISTLAISRKETGSWRVPALQFIFLTSLAYILTFITVNGLKAFGIN